MFVTCSNRPCSREGGQHIFSMSKFDLICVDICIDICQRDFDVILTLFSWIKLYGLITVKYVVKITTLVIQLFSPRQIIAEDFR